MKKRAILLLRYAGIASLLGILLFAIAWFAFPFPEEEYRRYDASRCITDKDGTILRTTLNSDGQRCFPVSLKDAGEWLPDAMVATEDKRFYEHHGVDFLATARAGAQFVWNRRVVSGASTITTQVVRLVKPRRRNVLSKAVEAFRALQMERLFTKEEILEQYLNRSPFGGNLLGIRSASLYYFSKEPADLSLDEAALLAGLPQCPNRLRPDRYPYRAMKRRETVLASMANAEKLSHESTDKVVELPVRLNLATPPFFAPHFVDAVLQGRVECHQAASGNPFQTQTTLDLSLQKMAEGHLVHHSPEKAGGAAILVLDVPTGNILAMVGSPDFENSEKAGQYNSSLALRSPGSTLKTFAYALAFDRGELVPSSILRDEASLHPGYQPGNFDGSFRGEVTARKALVESLNLPAIEVLEKAGLQNFLDTLQGLGIRSLDQPAGQYGLNLVLGGAGIRPLELARAYAKLAASKPGCPISGEAAWMVGDILSGTERDFAAYGHTGEANRTKVAWKTGTSARSRDAWTVAWNQQYVVCVWLGNPDGTPCPGLTGIVDAAPLALDIFHDLPNLQDFPAKPDWTLMMEQRQVCQATGLPASQFCKVTIPDWYIPGVSQNLPCTGNCGQPHATLPTKDSKTRILHPVNGQTFAILPGQPSPSLTLQADGDEELYWFVNGSFHAKAKPKEVLQFPLERGKFLICCTSGNGNTATAEIVVE